jgi:hypothetical protein
VDAIASIPDIVGDVSRELMVGCRNGGVFCISGGYDSTTTATRDNGKPEPFNAILSPNPCNEGFVLDIDLPVASRLDLTATDLAGRVVFKESRTTLPQGRSRLHFEGFRNNLTGNGMLILEIRTNCGTLYRKLLIR